MTRGRPRSQDARRAVLDAALTLCERDGYQPLTIKAIADHAGVGRQTVYRWWPDKQEILLEALIDLRETRFKGLAPDSGDTLRDVELVLRTTFELTQTITGQALIGLLSDAQRDPDLSKRLQDTVIGPRRDALRDILRRGVESGQLTETVPLDLVVDFAFGTMWYRLMHHHGPVDAGLARDITAAMSRLLAG
jgi:AcrR family transcriptional regulator